MEQVYIDEEKVISYQLELGKQLADVLTECSSRHHGKNVGKLFSELKLVTDNLFIYAEANREATESLRCCHSRYYICKHVMMLSQAWFLCIL